MVRSFKIGIDYHGVADQNPSFFSTFNQKAIKQGHQIYILSGAKKQDVLAFLKKNNISYTHIFSLLDYFKKQNLVTFFEDGNFFVPAALWDEAKAKYCLRQKIDIHIDDSPIYGKYFTTPFCLYNSTTKHCEDKRNNIVIDFNDTPENVLNQIIKELSLK